VLPNPASAMINITLVEFKNTMATIHIYDATARLVKTVLTAERTFSIERGDLQSGIYFIQLRTGNRTLTKKIVLE
jgi:hypothetical protein